MDNPASRLGHDRDGRATEVPPLFDALYRWLKQQQWATKAYEEIIEPAEVNADDRLFLDTKLLEAGIKKNGEHLDAGTTESIAGASSGEALALFSLAYALLQPDDAEAIVRSVATVGAEFGRFFGADDDSLNAVAMEARLQGDPNQASGGDMETPSEEESTWTSSDERALHAALLKLREEIRESGTALVESGTRMEKQFELPSANLLKDLSELQHRLNLLTNAIGKLLDASGLDYSDRFAGHRGIDSLLSALADLERSRQHGAGVVLVIERIGRLQLHGSADRALLEPCLAEAEELQHALDTGKPDPRLAEVAKGIHPLAQLVKLVEDLDALSDEEFEHLRKTVADAYGNKLARLVSRGVLTLVRIDESPAGHADDQTSPNTCEVIRIAGTTDQKGTMSPDDPQEPEQEPVKRPTITCSATNRMRRARQSR